MTIAPQSDEPGKDPPPLWTLANALTLLRLALAPLNAILIIAGEDLAAAGIFVLAVASDLADGPLARRQGGPTHLGSVLDHGSDAVFVVLGLGAFATRGLVPPVLPALLILAFAQYSLDSNVWAGRRLRASFLGRWNGISYFALLGTLSIRNAIGLSWPSDALMLVMGWLLAVSTLISMIDRILALRRGPGD